MRRPSLRELIPPLDFQQLNALRLIARRQGRLWDTSLPRPLASSLLLAGAVQRSGGELRLTHLGLLGLLQADATRRGVR